MPVIRRRRTDRFAIIPNSVAEDERLSFAERGLLVYLLAKPEGWTVQITDLQNKGGVGRDLAYKLLNGLIRNGYVRRDRHIDPATKRITGTTYTIFDLPEADRAQPLPDLPYPERPRPANQDTYKELSLNKTHYLSSADAREGFAELCEVLDCEHATALIEHFAGLGNPLSSYTAKLKAKQLDQCPDPNAACDEMVSNGWKNFRPGWMPKDRRAGEQGISAVPDPSASLRKVTGATKRVSRALEPELWRRCCAATGHRLSLTGSDNGWAFDADLVNAIRANGGSQ